MREDKVLMIQFNDNIYKLFGPRQSHGLRLLHVLIRAGISFSLFPALIST